LFGKNQLSEQPSRTAACGSCQLGRTTVFKSAGLRRANKVDLIPHWRKKNYDAV
jgi:hypothetical protein